MAAKKTRRKAAPRRRKAAPAARRRVVRRRRSAPQTTAVAARRRSGPSPALTAANAQVEKEKKAKNAALARARDAEDDMPIVEHIVGAPAGFLGGMGVQKFVSSRTKKNNEKTAAGTALTKMDERLADPEIVGSGLAAVISGLGILGHKFMPRGMARKAFAGLTLGASAGGMGAAGYNYSARKEAERAAAPADPATSGPGAPVYAAADQILAQFRAQLPPPQQVRGNGQTSNMPAPNRRAF